MKTNYVGAFLGTFFGAAVLILGVVRFGASMTMLPAGPILEAIQSREQVSDKALEVLISANERGLDWVNSGRVLTDLGLARLLARERVESKAEKKALLNAAIDDLERGLALAPANAFAWTRLALGRMLRDGATPDMIPPLRMSFLTAPYDPRLTNARLRLGLLAWPHLSRTERSQMVEQMKYSWRDDPDGLITLAKQTKRHRIIQAAFFRSPIILKEFNQLLRKKK